MSARSAGPVQGITDLAGIVAALRMLPAELATAEEGTAAVDGVFRQEWALVDALAAVPVSTFAEAADKAEAVVARILNPYGDGPAEAICDEHVALLMALVRDLRALSAIGHSR